MKIIAIEKELQQKKIGREILKEEARRIYTLYKQGKIREIYFTKAEHIAVILFEVRNISEARRLLKTLPLVQKLIIEFEIKELMPYTGYDRIISQME